MNTKEMQIQEKTNPGLRLSYKYPISFQTNGTMEDSRYAINGKLWKVEKGYKQQRIACI
jgi:hypothetical protein